MKEELLLLYSGEQDIICLCFGYMCAYVVSWIIKDTIYDKKPFFRYYNPNAPIWLYTITTLIIGIYLNAPIWLKFIIWLYTITTLIIGIYLFQ